MTKVKKFASAFLVVGLSSVLLNSALSNTDKPLDFKEPKHDKSLVSQRISQLNEKIYNNSNDTSLKNKNKI